MNASVLVTGGAGYIGSHACKALARAGFRPIAYDNLAYGHAEAVKWGPLVDGDIADGPRLRAVLSAERVVAVMHFAAFAYVGESMSDPAKYFRNNTTGTLTLLDAMRDVGVDRMVFSSTCATYGIPGEAVDGMDVLEVAAAGDRAVEHAKSGKGPYILEMKTYRYRGHSMSDPAKYRSKEEVDKMRTQHDPIDHLAKYLMEQKLSDEAALKKIDREVKAIVTDAADFFSAASSSAVSLIWMICSMPFAPSFTGTPQNSPLIPYSPSR